MATTIETRTVCPECVKNGWVIDPRSQFLRVVYILCRTHQIASGKGIIGELVKKMARGNK